MTQVENNTFATVRALIFDLDGTLIDSKLDLALAVNAAREHLGLSPLTHETIFGFVGQGAPTLIRRSLGQGATDAHVEQALAYFLQYYWEHMLDNTVLYPGVREGLEQLDSTGKVMAILTNKPARFSRTIVSGLGVAKYFKFVYGGNSFERKKPDPIGVEVLRKDMEVEATESMMIGDSEIDIQTARNAGIWACGVTYGLGSHTLTDHPPDLLIDSLADLPLYLSGRDATA